MHAAQARALSCAQTLRGFIHPRRHASESGTDRLQGNGEKAHQIGIDQRGNAAREHQSRIMACQRLPQGRQPMIELRHRNQDADRHHRTRHGVPQTDQPVQCRHPASPAFPTCQACAIGQCQGERDSE